MPIYAYRCANCGFEQDVLQKMSDAPLSVCPNCGQPEMKKQVTAAGFQLKGSGWYVTDFRNNTQGKAKEKDAVPGKGDQPAGDAKAADASAAPASDSTKPTSGDTKSAASPAASPASSSTPSSDSGGSGGSSGSGSSSGSGGSGGPGGSGKSGASAPLSWLLCF